MSIRLLVADDHQIVQYGLRSMLADSGVEIVAEASDGDRAVELAQEHKPDVVLLDVRLKNDDGLAALKAIKARLPNTAVLMFSNFDNPTYVARAMAQGAAGFLMKDVTRDQLIQAIETVAQGSNIWTPAEIRRFTGTLRSGRAETPTEVSLTHRESEVLHQMAYGLTNKEIADALNISYETVKEHVQHILKKLGVSDRTQAAVWAVRKGLV